MNRTEQSKKVILENQASSGAFVASPAFAHYGYSWLRDGAFIAHGLDCAGEEKAAAAFYSWAGRTIERYRKKAENVIQLVLTQQDVPQESLLHTRYTADGWEVNGDWGTFQLDGYGTLLWGAMKHIEMWKNHSLLTELQPTIELITEYLLCLWERPNFDCWEEYGDQVHPATIAAIYGGLTAVLPILSDALTSRVQLQLQEMKNYVLQKGTAMGRFTKSIQNSAIDASLMWLHVPYGMIDAEDPLLRETIRTIEEQLLFDGGVHRYPQDVYYGGGQWILLSAYLGWHYVEVGEPSKAVKLLEWIEAQFDEHGFLPEQVRHHLLAPEENKNWIQKWGPPAKPLLWSHAMHLIIKSKLAHTEDIQ
jgi:GH15 family glucan-1,4-alpha-glucosidase